ncbi:M16 family metallopeptidase [Prevotella communis]|uniref:M16 family metallopeptidase n=1 Tax=Prevotella communis TaxID=2913614 RepID=UPI001EDB0834|nr:pitrilysin family protein [Prevotella communis]UKK56559.1 insulinase family protein [Prevotella communis]UKK62086.1 insulinase family protein [Prevotella communis]UKK64913.1 insulinase family protein [Prevotella communis]
MTRYNTITLENGLRIIHLPSDSQVVYCGIAVKVGTRHELPGEEGLAHFCEHLSFKGTEHRSAVQIINAIEGLGGELNAFTNKEDTVFYCAIQARHFMKAVNVLCDIVFHSTYPQSEVEKEREVVCDEIESYEDSPAELIFDEIENILFEGHPLGHNILGTSEQVRQYTSEDARRFTARYYRPDNCVFFASGNVNFKRLATWLRASCKDNTHISERSENLEILEKPENQPERLLIRHRGTHQAHVIIGSRAYAADDQRRWALYLLNNIIGGPGLNSRLNLSLRERNGLVYSVESSMVCYGDTGCWCTYFGCDPHDVKRCCRLVRRELDRLIKNPLSTSQLLKAKQQLQGQLAIASDSREQFALDFAKNFLHQGKERDLSDIMQHIDSLTSQDLQQVAREIFDPEHITTLIYE